MDTSQVSPDITAVRTALWRALHLQIDSPPHVLTDDIGLKLVAPDAGWQNRPDMGSFTRPFRASILARARFVEDLVTDQVAQGVGQYVILGAGLDSFAQRRKDLTSRMQVFEIDRRGPQQWKRQRLIDLGFGLPGFLKLVPVDLEAGEVWTGQLCESGFVAKRRAILSSLGVSMYLSRTAIMKTLRQIAVLAPGTTLVMSFMLPIEQLDDEIRPAVERAANGALVNGTPFVSFFMPDEILKFASDAGFKEVKHVSADMLAERYFSARTDGLRPPSNSEELIVART